VMDDHFFTESEKGNRWRTTEMVDGDEVFLIAQKGDKSSKGTLLYGLSAAALLAVVAVCCIYFRPWNRREDGMPVSPYLKFQQEEFQCHEGCRQHDMANSKCLQECLPDKMKCLQSDCAAMSPDSSIYSSCALDCHSSVCEKQCSDTGLRASLCHMSCTPDRTLVDDPPCVKKCNLKHDASCMADCAQKNQKCLNAKCIGKTQEEYEECQQECEVKSCGHDCQEASKAFAECTAQCYPANPSGGPAAFIPPSVQAADSAFLRTSHCKESCRDMEMHHGRCMHFCGPKIAACMDTACPAAVPDSVLQKNCMKSCEFSSCGDVCQKASEEVKHCYQEACHPDDATTCRKKCDADHDDSCMKKCSSTLGSCFASKCNNLMNQEGTDEDAYNTCQKTCMENHCGVDCARRSMAHVFCNNHCDEATMKRMKK